MRTGIFMAALMAFMLLVPAAHAASDPASEKLLKSTSDHTKFKALQRTSTPGPKSPRPALRAIRGLQAAP